MRATDARVVHSANVCNYTLAQVITDTWHLMETVRAEHGALDVGFRDGEKGDNSLCMRAHGITSESPLGGGRRSRQQCHKMETPHGASGSPSGGDVIRQLGI